MNVSQDFIPMASRYVSYPPWIAVLLSLLFVGLNVVTADRSPRPWVDEVMFADPGFNLASGEGFVTRWWRHQREEHTFVSNSPLYSLMLGGWSRVVGVSIIPVRTLNYLLMLAAVSVLALAVVRAEPRVGSVPIALMTVAMWTGYGMTFSYRSARYDVLGLLLLALAALVLTIPQRRARLVLLLLLGAYLPLAGLHLLPYAATLGLLVLLLDRRMLADTIALGMGAVAGFVGFVSYIYSLGLFDTFKNSVLGLSDHMSSAGDRLQNVIDAILLDPSTLILGAAILILVALPGNRHLLGWQILATAAFAIIVIPVVLSIAGKFPVYYSWMKFMPMCIVVCFAYEKLIRHHVSLAPFIIIVGVVASSYGLGGRVYLSTMHWESNRSHHIDTFVGALIHSEDRVVATPLAYFAARRVTPIVYSIEYISRMDSTERESISLLLVAPSETSRATRAARGEWELVARFHPPGATSPPEGTSPSHVYHVVHAYRRVPTPSGDTLLSGDTW